MHVRVRVCVRVSVSARARACVYVDVSKRQVAILARASREMFQTVRID